MVLLTKIIALFWYIGGGYGAFYYGHFIGLVAFLTLSVGICNWWEHAFLKAGPRTSRQVPRCRVPRCVQLSATALHEAYKEGTLSCVEVTRSYIELIEAVNPYLNLIVFDCFDEAMRSARSADAKWKAWRETGRARGEPEPSFVLGVPCTIKECMLCIGCPNTSGNPAREGLFGTRDSHVVGNFRRAGAIILGVTNTSEVCMWYESSNYVYGISCNPYDTRCLVGGSSGGEGACAGAAFACFGLGSDIGGSIRMPAFFNGVYGLKATPHLICNEGQFPGAKASANHFMATGPITRFIEDILPLARIAAQGGFGMDPVEYPPASPLSPSSTIPNTPWELPLTKTHPSAKMTGMKKVEKVDSTKKKESAPLRLYLLEDYGVPLIQVSAAQKEAVRVAGETLAHAMGGAEIVYINVRDKSRCTGGKVPKPFQHFSESFSFWTHAVTTDPSENSFSSSMSEGLGNISWIAEFFRWTVGASRHTLPAIILCVLEQMEKKLPRLISVGHAGPQLSTFRDEMEELLGETGVLIAPTFPTAAPRHHYPIWNPFQFQYTAVFNVLQLPVVACPVWLGEEMSHSRRALTRDECREANLPADFHLPKGVQLVGKRNTDEMLLGLARVLDEQLKGGGYRYPGWADLE